MSAVLSLNSTRSAPARPAVGGSSSPPSTVHRPSSAVPVTTPSQVSGPRTAASQTARVRRGFQGVRLMRRKPWVWASASGPAAATRAVNCAIASAGPRSPTASPQASRRRRSSGQSIPRRSGISASAQRSGAMAFSQPWRMRAWRSPGGSARKLVAPGVACVWPAWVVSRPASTSSDQTKRASAVASAAGSGASWAARSRSVARRGWPSAQLGSGCRIAVSKIATAARSAGVETTCVCGAGAGSSTGAART